MELLIIIVVLVAIGIFLLFRTGTIKYQVEFYLKKYSQLLSQGYSKDKAVSSLMNFYLQNEPSWKTEYMQSRYNNYIKNIDELIQDIVFFYFNVDPSFQVSRLDNYSSPVNIVTMQEKLKTYLRIYKMKYGIK